jgi:hypothetical protein
MSDRTALYRIFGDADLLLYIGISDDFGIRWKAEARKFPWWDEHRRMTVEWLDSRPEAEAAETAAIKAEKPKYNKQHNRPASERRPRRRLSEPGRILNAWIGTLIRDLRESRRMTQAELAAEMKRRGFPWYQATVYTVESGRRETLFSEARAIAEIFGFVSVDAFTPPWDPVYDDLGNVICEPIVPFPDALIPERAA